MSYLLGYIGDSMNKLLLFTTLMLAITLTACGPSAPPTALPTVILSGNPVLVANAITASGEIVPKPRAKLSFPITGIVKTVVVQAGDKVRSGQLLAMVDPTILEAVVREREANVTSAQTQVALLERSGTEQEHLNSALADVLAAQASLDSARAALTQATLNAPFDGTVASVDISPSETVIPGQEIIMLGDLSHFQVETTDLSEHDVPSVQIGQGANVFIQALNLSFGGKVIDVSRISSTVGGDVVFKAIIELDSQPAGLRWGMTTKVEIKTGM